MMSITCYGGVGEVGGNKVLLEDGDTRFFFDFGFPFKKRARYFEEFLNPRPGAGLLDLLETGLLPPLKGVLREDLAKKSLWDKFSFSPLYRELKVDGVLLTHAHIDHSGYISFLRDDIPIYTTIMTAFVSKAMQDSVPPNFEKEVCYSLPKGSKGGYMRSAGTYKPRPFAFLDRQALSDEAQDFWYSSPRRKRPLSSETYSCAPGKIGKLPLRYFPVDHSIPGAAAFAVETSVGWVGYTGDLRFHGGASEKSEEFVEEMHRLRPHVLLCEGTRLKEKRGASEEEAFRNCLRAVRGEANGLVIADFGARNVERLVAFYNIALETGRKLIIMGKDAYLLDAMHLASDKVPDIGDIPEILIYKDFKSKRPSWEAEIHRHYSEKIIPPADIRENPQKFILCFSYWDANDLIDISLQGGTYIYSASEVFDEEGAMDMRRLANWIDLFGMKGIGLPREELNWDIPESEKGYHSSGHACGEDLLELIRRIDPKILIPIHTEDPGYFVENLRGTGIEVRPPVEGQLMNFY